MSRYTPIRTVAGLLGAAVLTACAARFGQPPEVLSDIAPPEYVELVRLSDADLAEDDIEMTCQRVSLPGSRIVIGMRCEPVADAPNFAFNEWYFWETEIFAPGLYVMRRKR